MKTIDKARYFLKSYLSHDMESMLCQHHRYYHNRNHVLDVLTRLFDTETEHKLSEFECYKFAGYHDLVYDPRSQYNEKKSIKILLNDYPNSTRVANLISLTKYEWKHRSELSDEDWAVIKCDIGLFFDDSSIQETELNIFKEYQFISWAKYRSERIKFLSEFKNKIDCESNIDKRIEFLNQWKPKIGVFVGSFNPFHIGHLNVLNKASNVFDKVIVASGINTDKENPNSVRVENKSLRYIETREYSGLLTEFIKSLEEEMNLSVSIIRGIRNGDDLAYESNLANTLRDLNRGKPYDIHYILCDREYAHISSTVVRGLQSFGVNELYLT